MTRQRVFQRSDELGVILIHFELVRDLQQARRARILGVVAMAESRRRDLTGHGQPIRERRCGIGHGASAAHHRQAVVEQLPAGEGIGAVMAAEAEDAGGHRAP